MTRPKMIIFDYGGTLLQEPECDFDRGEEKVFEHVVRNPNHLNPQELSLFGSQRFGELQQIRDLGYEAHEFQMLRFKYEYNEITLDISYEEAENILWDHTSPLTEQAKVPYVSEMLDFVRQQHIRTGIISNIGWSGRALARRIHKLLPDHDFEFVIASCEYGIRKPDKRIFDLALKKAGLTASEVWYCGDTFDLDIVGAYHAGIYPIYYHGMSSEKLSEEQINKNADVRYTRISDWKILCDLLQKNV